MKPEHLPWIDQIWQRLEAAASTSMPVNTMQYSFGTKLNPSFPRCLFGKLTAT